MNKRFMGRLSRVSVLTTIDFGNDGALASSNIHGSQHSIEFETDLRQGRVKFEKTAKIKATPSEIWSLVEDIESVAGCIPGLTGFEEVNDTEFNAILNQRVGPVAARFELNTKLTDLVEERSVTAVSEGRDSNLDASVRAEQLFVLTPAGDETDISISADVRFTGSIATFGQRIISTKAEQVVLESLANVSSLLEDRRADTG